MAYSFQTFSVGQVLTASQMNQVEVNIRDHLHGTSSVLALGHTFNNPSYTEQTLTDGATIGWDMNVGSRAYVTLTASGHTLGLPTNRKRGTSILHVIQDGVGSRTMLWHSVYKFPGDVAPVLTLTAARKDCFSLDDNGTSIYVSHLPDLAA